MTNTQNAQPTHPPSQPSEPDPPFLSLHTTVVRLAAAVIGIVLGCLTALAGTSAAGAVVAGLTAAGASVPVLRSLVR
ncbi:hypothetical protein ACH4GP_32485 [Streptomyces celluloflavus]|uniref:Lipoprotein n=1 Tax=Streptomyces celluloflavus TaxID=58344 RepID=A0ABW7RRV0_9ACTN